MRTCYITSSQQCIFRVMKFFNHSLPTFKFLASILLGTACLPFIYITFSTYQEEQSQFSSIKWVDAADPLTTEEPWYYLWDVQVPEPKERFSEEMQTKVADLYNDFEFVYKTKMKSMILCQMANDCPVRVLAYEASNHSLSYGGLADRLRGIISLMYTAFASDRVFIINWTLPYQLNEMLTINEELYGVDLFEYQTFLENKRLRETSFHERSYYFDFDNTSHLLSDTHIVSISTVDMRILESTYQFDQRFRSRYKLLVNLADARNLMLSYELLAHLALRMLFSKPKDIVTKMVEFLWKDSTEGCDIGLHLRLSPPNVYDRYTDWPRATKEQVTKCFIEKTKEVAGQCLNDSKNPRVFIASDSSEAKVLAAQIFRKSNIPAFFANNSAVHIDKDWSNFTFKEREAGLAQTIAEWLVLSKMNQLIISRSGFSEMASTFGGFRASRLATLRLPLDYSNNCIFETDYHITESNAADHRPPNRKTTPSRFQN